MEDSNKDENKELPQEGAQYNLFGGFSEHKHIEKRQKNTIRRDNDIRARFKELYDEDRKRIDDCVKILCKEFYLEEFTINAILANKKRR